MTGVKEVCAGGMGLGSWDADNGGLHPFPHGILACLQRARDEFVRRKKYDICFLDFFWQLELSPTAGAIIK